MFVAEHDQVRDALPTELSVRDNAPGALEILAARWHTLLLVPIAFGVAAWFTTFALTTYYTSSTTFITDAAEPQGANGNFAGVAAQLGLGSAAAPTKSPQFFADLLRSRSVFEAVLESRIPEAKRAGATDSVQVLDLYTHKKGDVAHRLADGIRELSKHTSVSVNPRTSIVELLVAAPQPAAAKLVTERFVASLGHFNLTTRQSQARERLRFASLRLAEARDSLAREEAIQQDFLQSNRAIRNSPALEADNERISRQLTMYQETYETVRREYESARVDVINDTPVLTIIDSATVPLRRSAPQRGMMASLGALLGAFAAFGYLFAKIAVVRLRQTDPEGYERLEVARQTFRRSLRRTERRA